MLHGVRVVFHRLHPQKEAKRYLLRAVRVTYSFHRQAMSLYRLTRFAKNERVNLSKAQRNALVGLVDVLQAARTKRSKP